MKGFPAVSFREMSSNVKLSPVDHVPKDEGRPGTYRNFYIRPRPPFVSSTYVSIDKTCPDTCAFKGNGCMAESGFTRVLGRRLDVGAIGLSGEDVARQEAAAIDQAFHGKRIPGDGLGGRRDLRLHVGGDVASAEAARILAQAAARWLARGGGTVWTFTHRWRDVPREAWGCISVLASVETIAQSAEAFALGYAPALVVPEFPNGQKAWRPAPWLKAVPCPAETGKRTCVECRLCLDRPLHEMGVAIAFAAHGHGAEQVQRALTQEAA